MKAIYINLDPYLAAVAAWIKAGKPGTAPSFDPLPLAVTVPLGQTAAILLQSSGATAGERAADTITVDDVSLNVQAQFTDDEAAAVAFEFAPGFSTVAPASQYMVSTVSADSVPVTVHIYDEDENDYGFDVSVLVRRETASGPVDLVDFTPPAAAPSAASINAALGGNGATESKPLNGVLLNGAKFTMDGETESSSLSNTTDPVESLGGLYGIGLTSPGS